LLHLLQEFFVKTIFAASLVFACFLFSFPALALEFETDTIQTSSGALEITFLGHASLLLSFNGKNIYVDPVTEFADFSKQPRADIILVTHDHKDHFDMSAIEALRTDNTLIVLTELCATQYKEGIVMRNEDVKIVSGLKIEGVPAYNIVHKRTSGFPYHFKGIGNAYILTLGDKRVYVAGDTEKIPEMKELSDIDIAFLPVSYPTTMTVEMAADAVRTIRPKIFYPYHYNATDLTELVDSLEDLSGTEVRIRKMQ
jgi:L-ascorbate metabolism protein UlaG (beta-lactamase superfamily)